MKKLIIILFALSFSAFSVTKAQDNTIIVSENSTRLSAQSYVTSGYGRQFPKSEVNDYLIDGKYITSVAYTLEGWFVVMSKTSEYYGQEYRYTDDFPKDWIRAKAKENYIITDIAWGNGKWLVVMSDILFATTQTYRSGQISSLKGWINDNWQKGFYITSATYIGDDNWLIVMIKTDKYNDQSYATRSSANEAFNIVNSKCSQGYIPTIVEYGNGYYFCVSSKLSDYGVPSMKLSLYNDNVKSYVTSNWNENYNISYIGGGLKEYENNNSSNSTSTADALIGLGNALQSLGNTLGGQKGNTNNTYQGSGSTYGSGSSYGSGSGSTNKCRECLGNGKCSGSGTSSKYHCHGSGKCYACNGKGWKEVAGHLSECGVCNKTGKCKYCNGTGRCSRCNGTGTN